MWSVRTRVYVHFQFQVRGALRVGEHPRPVVLVFLISLDQLCAVQAAEKTRRQTEGALNRRKLSQKKN